MNTLYHASSNATLTTIQPQRTVSNDAYIGDFVFATASIVLAAMYLANKGIATLMEHRAEHPYIIIQDDAEHYIEHDVGGAIYTVGAESFHETPQRGLEETEFVSSEAVTPLSIESYATSLTAMEKHGIAVYFVAADRFQAILDNKNANEAVAELEAYHQS